MIEASEYKTVLSVCERMGFTPQKLYDLVNLKVSPLDKNGAWKKIVMDLCDLLHSTPDDLFSEEQINNPIEKNNFTLTANLEELGRLSERQLSTSQEFKVLEDNTKDVLSKILDEHLSPRQKDILIRSFGLFGVEKQTLDEIGKVHGVGRERARQIVSKSIRNLQKIKHLKGLNNSDSLKALKSLLAEHDDAHQGRLY
jgi:RNA polymerase sigma factor (sigma-70 family)